MRQKSSNEPRVITPEVVFGQNARQLEAWNASESHRFLLYGGAAGGGKSFFLRWWAAFFLLWLHFKCGISRAQVGLFCEDYPSLIDRQVSKIRAEFPSELGELKQGVTLDYELRPQYGSGRILLRNLDDPSKYLSSEFAGIAVDELTRNNAETFHFLRLRLRWPGVDRPRFVAGSNPGGKGHGWVQHYWIDREFPRELEPLAKEFYFVPAKMQDNPFLPQSYYQDLLTLPEAMAKAYAEGRWDLFAGQYFDFWESLRDETVQDERTWNLQPWNTRWISIDWGFEHPACAHWFCLADDGVTRTYREFHRNHLGPRELGAEIGRLSDGERISHVYLSPDAFAKRTDELSIAEQVGDVLSQMGFPRPVPADNDRVGGWMLLYQMLQSGQWRIGSTCRELIRAIPVAVRDEKRVEDIAKFDAANGIGGDDALDCARYGLKSKHGIAAKPRDVQARELVAQMIPDQLQAVNYTAIAQASLKAQEKLNKKFQPVPLMTRKRRYGGGFHGFHTVR